MNAQRLGIMKLGSYFSCRRCFLAQAHCRTSNCRLYTPGWGEPNVIVGQQTRLIVSDWRIVAIIVQTNFREASNNALQSPVPSSTIQHSSSPTSPLARWIARRATKSSRYLGSLTRKVVRSLSLRTPPKSPTAHAARLPCTTGASWRTTQICAALSGTTGSLRVACDEHSREHESSAR